jgi:hypothetical protein
MDMGRNGNRTATGEERDSQPAHPSNSHRTAQSEATQS